MVVRGDDGAVNLKAIEAGRQAVKGAGRIGSAPEVAFIKAREAETN
jgi:hypothetical protein